MTTMTTIRADEIPSNYKLHHTASAMGYVSRRTHPADYPVESYSGRFGEGYVVRSPRWDTSRYCNVTYYIKEV